LIRVEGLGKRFRLFHERPRTIKEVITLRRRRSFDEFWALRDVSLNVAAGETVGIIGANGSGKSTLLKCLARILVPDEGSLSVTGRVGALLELGAGFHPELTGRENVFLNGSILGVRRRELKARFDEVVALAGLERFIDTPVKNYSSGMYIRLGFAVAVSVRPDVLLVDEVLAVGDEEFQRKSLAKFKELRSDGRAIVLVTHNLKSVREMCDRAVLLRDGRVVEIGPADSVVEAYLRSVGPPVAAGGSLSAEPRRESVEVSEAVRR
jgi:ABC-type polysaccharide/polyol phosphate transport system ATPase subunit